jgi:hypothetical protein
MFIFKIEQERTEKIGANKPQERKREEIMNTMKCFAFFNYIHTSTHFKRKEKKWKSPVLFLQE